jgi:nitroreductase
VKGRKNFFFENKQQTFANGERLTFLRVAETGFALSGWRWFSMSGQRHPKEQTAMTEFEGRTADHPIEPLFIERWSPRAFTGEAMDQATLLTIFEAARWAPSSYNSQPWRFVYAHRDTPAWETLFGLLVEGNQAWCARAAVLMVALSKTMMSPRGEEVPSHSHSFDAGAAWQNIALQTTLLGWHAHGMVGLDMKRAITELGVPHGYHVECAIALGRRGDASTLPERVQTMEKPNGRNPVESFIFEGIFEGIFKA